MNNTQRKICAGAVSVFSVRHQLITAIERRKEHPRCRYCKSVCKLLTPITKANPVYLCLVKYRITNGDIPRIFCGAFEPVEN